jgi:hypothetical protein
MGKRVVKNSDIGVAAESFAVRGCRSQAVSRVARKEKCEYDVVEIEFFLITDPAQTV